MNTSPAMVVADANWGSTYLLFSELHTRIPVYLLKTSTIQQARGAGWLKREFLRLREIDANLYERRLVFPPAWFSIFAPLSMRIVGYFVRRDLRRLGLRCSTLVLSYPQYRRVAPHIRPERLLYYCVDDYRCYWPDRAKQIEVSENRLVQEADVTLCTAAFMKSEFARRNPNRAGRIHHLPNGTRESFLAAAPLSLPDPLPADVAHIARPVLGYLGSIDGRIDWEVVEAVLKRFPQASLLFVGAAPPAGTRDGARIQRLRGYPNLHFVGFRSQDCIMQYIRAFDICLVPEPNQPISVGGCPQKLWNYLASSRPIVSTRIPEQAMWEPAVSIADDGEQFCDHIARLLACGGNDGLASRRLEIARAHTWPRLAERLWGFMDGEVESTVPACCR
jgi:glycosyltransferase involved in cell wall biosynthesis